MKYPEILLAVGLAVVFSIITVVLVEIVHNHEQQPTKLIIPPEKEVSLQSDFDGYDHDIAPYLGVN